MSDRRKTFVLAHGFWHGGWCWTRVADRLRSLGHRAFAPSYAGLGDRAHLLGPDITIDTFVQDLVALIQTHELAEVVLVGHSFGGVPITGVADRIPETIAHLVYLDAVVVEGGASAFSTYPPEEAKARIAAAERANGGLAIPPPASLSPSWGLKEGTADCDWVMRRLTPHPLRACTSALALRSPVGNGLPRTYVRLTESSLPVIDNSARLVRAWPGWIWIELAAPHEAMITHPDEIVRILVEI
ncbi:MAG: alpha/beta fold hydrolase [Methylocella sp.]